MPCEGIRRLGYSAIGVLGDWGVVSRGCRQAGILNRGFRAATEGAASGSSDEGRSQQRHSNFRSLDAYSIGSRNL